MASMTAGRSRNHPPQPEVDVRQIIHEAQTRWLRPVEVCEILRNYKFHNFKLNPVPPTQPISGSLFLFDRKALRYFRKDGHNWRKKKDGKTVREAHERLKAGSVDVLHCYYAHGEDNVNFQRRCYWMLDPSYEHIVLVHYREVTENNRSCIIRNMHDYTTPANAVYNPQFTTQSPLVSPAVSALTNSSHPSVASPETVEAPCPTLSPELDEAESAEPDELEDPGLEGEGDQPGLQPSLLEQLGDQHLSSGHSLAGGNQWQGLRNPKSLGVIDGQFSPLFSTQDTDFKPSYAELGQHLPVRIPPATQNVNNPLLPSFSRGDVGSISKQFEAMLESPGPSQGSLSQRGSSSTHLQLTTHQLSSFLQNGGGRSVKNESPWVDMLAAVTTPGTRRTLLDNIGYAHSPLGKDAPPVHGPPLSPKGIVDALSPRNLGRMPQTHLEENLRAMTEKGILKKAEEKAQAQRRLQATHGETNHVDAVSQRNQEPMNGNQFIESDTLEELVRSGQSHQDSFSTFSKDKRTWMQQSPLQNEQQQQLLNFQPVNQYDQQNTKQNQEGMQQEKLQPIFPPPQPNSFSFLDNGGEFSPTVEHLLKDVQTEESHHDVMESYKKLDSFGRWMNSSGFVTDSPSPFIGSTAVSLWDSPLVSLEGLSGQTTQMEVGLNPSPSILEQYFNISDFSPEWGSSAGDTKVLITGSFVGNINPSDHRWACMFGEIEVPADLLDSGALRCKAPKHGPGRVSFYITRTDRFACSQVREFEFRDSGTDQSLETEEDLRFKLSFARMLMATTSSSFRHGTRNVKFKECEDDEWRKLEKMLDMRKPLAEVKEQLMQLIFKRRLQEWLLLKKKEEGIIGPSLHDDRGQGVSHYTAALGYAWSIKPLLSADISINFRDKRGWTALHWAAYCGREEVVCALLDAGATASLITDPTPTCPAGQTPSDLASARGHNGLAAFLSEKALTTRLSCLNLNDGILVDEGAAAMAGDKAVAALERRSSIRSSVRAGSDQQVLLASMRAVRNSTQAATILRDAIRQQEFRDRERKSLCGEDQLDEYGLSDEQVRSMLAARKIQKAYRSHQKAKSLHIAATAIQRKFRGWKGRKDFQTLRQRIIKIQAHVRGRLVRNQFRKILWSVSIVEKVVLRWLRKRKGLRGFRSDGEAPSFINDDDDDLIREGRHRNHAAVEKDVQRVHDMARQKAAREQYNRLAQMARGEHYNAYTDHGQSSKEYMLNLDAVMATVE